MSKIIPLMERDGRETYFHGAVVLPDHRTADAVEQDLRRIYGEVMASSDEWNYDDIFQRFRQAGYTVLEAEQVFYEHQADPIGGPSVRAEVHSDDHAAEATFDASPWFRQASDEEIEALAGIDWGGDYEADDVARFAQDTDPGVAEVFSYVEKRAIGFECHVDAESAQEWVRQNRPALYTRLTAGG